jgi:hypothetical protein
MITVFTIAYNGYGSFLPAWCDNIRKQKSKADKVIIVLGKDHGANVDDLNKIMTDYDFTIIESDSDVMGVLRNLALDKIKTKWMLYFSADDILLPNAIETIKKSKADVVALTYIDRNTKGGEKIVKSAIFNKVNIVNWIRLYAVPGYCAVKSKIKGKKIRYEDIEIPNYPYLFELASAGANFEHSEDVVAVYARREKSHGDINFKNNRFKEFSKYINDKARQHYIDNLNKSEKLKAITLTKFKDIKSNSVKIPGNIIIDDKARILHLSKLRLVEVIDIVK